LLVKWPVAGPSEERCARFSLAFGHRFRGRSHPWGLAPGIAAPALPFCDRTVSSARRRPALRDRGICRVETYNMTGRNGALL